MKKKEMICILLQKRNYKRWEFLFRGILGGDPQHKIQKLLDRDISDPWYTGNFEVTYQDLLEGIDLILQK